MGLFCDSDMVNPLLKTNARRDRFAIFVVRSDIIVYRWLVVAWGENPCLSLPQISSLVFLVLFKEGTQGEFRFSSLAYLWRKRHCDHKGARYTATKGERFYYNVCCTYLVKWKLVVHAGNREMY